MIQSAITTILTIFTLLSWAATGSAQLATQQSGARLLMTRAELQGLLDSYGAQDRGGLRAVDRAEIDLIRARLQNGDFQPGDQVALAVEGHEQLTNTFTVVTTARGPALRLPELGDVALAGVLRSEIEQHLSQEVKRYIRNAVVHAEATLRISILQGVQRPGYYAAGAEDLITDLLMLAGGPSPQADLGKIRIERGKERIWQGDALQEAIVQGRTIDQLSLRAGDMIIVPVPSQRQWLTVLQATSIIIPAIFTLSRLF